MARGTKGGVGVVGLGAMGGAFARHLAAAGWRVCGFDIATPRMRAAARAGVAIAPDVATLAASVPVMIFSLPQPEALDETVAAITRAKLTPKTVIETSTFALADKQRAERRLRRTGHLMLDCPVSGTSAQAAAKDIVIYASGDHRSIAKLRRLFSDFARAVFDVGAFGNGSRMKYVANHLVTIHNVAAAEAMVLGIQSGLDPQMIYDLITAGAGTSRMFEIRAPAMVKNKYDGAGMSIRLFQKDIAVIADHAKGIGVPTPMFSASVPVYAAAMSLGYGEHDAAAVCAALQGMAGLKRDRRRRPRKMG